MAKPALLSPAAYARHRASRGLVGSSRESVRKAVAEGRITLIDGKIDPTVADIQWAANTRARVRNAGSDPAPIAPQPAAGPIIANDADPRVSYEEARRRRELAEASIAEMKQAELAGDLIRIDAVRHALSSKVSAMRDSFLQIPSRLSPQLAATNDSIEIARLLEGEIRQALEQISTYANDERSLNANPSP